MQKISNQHQYYRRDRMGKHEISKYRYLITLERFAYIAM